MVAIFVVSGTPKDKIPELGLWDLLLKKGSHMAAYALLAILWSRALRSRLPPLNTSPSGVGALESRRAFWLALAITALYAISDELHQTFVPGRNGTGADVMVDAAGALLGLWGWRLLGRP